MKRILVAFFLLAAHFVYAQDVAVIKINDLEKLMRSDEKEILVMNFWATWCAPCVKELPYFEELNKQENSNAKVVLISLDYAENVNRVKSFVSRKQMHSAVFLLDEIDYNSWIDKVDPSWQGAIPATLIINTRTGQRKFVAKELAEGQLNILIQEISKG